MLGFMRPTSAVQSRKFFLPGIALTTITAALLVVARDISTQEIYALEMQWP